jgi:hypothetical protein
MSCFFEVIRSVRAVFQGPERAPSAQKKEWLTGMKFYRSCVICDRSIALIQGMLRLSSAKE